MHSVSFEQLPELRSAKERRQPNSRSATQLTKVGHLPNIKTARTSQDDSRATIIKVLDVENKNLQKVILAMYAKL